MKPSRANLEQPYFLQKSTIFIILITLISTSFIYLFVRDIPLHIANGHRGHIAIKTLDEVRRPLLHIHKAESSLLGDGYSKTIHESLKHGIDRGRHLIADFKTVSAYNPELLKRVGKFASTFEEWIKTEQVLFDQSAGNGSNNFGLMSNVKNLNIIAGTSRYFSNTMDILGDAEIPIHNDIQEGSLAVTEIIIVGGTLLVVLISMVFFLQWFKNKKLRELIILNKQAEERTKSLAHILEESFNEIYMFDAKTLRFIRVNKGARLNLGYSMEEFDCMTPMDLKPEFTSESFEKLLEPLRAGKKEKIQFTTVHKRKDGSLYDIEVHLQLSTFQSIPVFVAIILDVTERKQVEITLQNSEERYRSLIEATTSIIWTTDESGGFVVPQLSWEKYTGQPWSEHKDFGWTKKIHPDDIEHILKAWEKAIRELSLYETWGHVWNANLKEWRDFEVRAVPIMNPDGSLREWVGIITDITERKQVEKKLKELNESLEDRVMERTADVIKLSHAVEHSSNTIMITDAKGNIEYVNPKFTQLTGYTSEEVLGKNPRFLKSGKTPLKTYTELWERITTGREWHGEFCNKKKNGELYWESESFSIVKNNEGVITNIVAVKEDITERKQMEEELRMLNESLELRVSERTAELAKSNEELRSSKNSLTKAQHIAKMGNWDWDIVNNTLHWSDEIYRIFGLKPQEFDATYEAFLRSVHPCDREAVKKAVNEAIYDSVPYSIEHRIVLPGGAERVVHEQAEVAFDEKGKPIRMIGTVQDVTELKKREEELVKAQKLDSIGVLAGGIAHDFNNYLQGIMSCINVAQAHAGSDEKIQEQLDKALKVLSQSKSLSQRLLTFSKGGDPKKQTIFISKLIKDSVTLVISSSRFDCHIGVSDNLWPVEADKGQLNQVFCNIVFNAKQAMPNGGKINVSAENFEIKKRALFPLKEGKYVKVAFKDQGTGISHENLQKIFDPYFTTKESGNGLGLATSFSIIKRHGGHIDVESELGVGTIFYIYLPASMKVVMKEMSSLSETKKIESAEKASING